MKDITPAKFRCGLGQCPGAYRSDDGFTAIRGAGNYTDFQDDLPPAGKYETYVVLPVGFLEAMFEEWLQNREELRRQLAEMKQRTLTQQQLADGDECDNVNCAQKEPQQ